MVDWLKPLEMQKWASVSSGSCAFLHGNAINSGIVHEVQNETNVHEAQEPKASRRSSAVKDSIGHCFDHLTAMLSWVLVLLMQFTLPLCNDERAQDVSDLV